MLSMIQVCFEKNNMIDKPVSDNPDIEKIRRRLTRLMIASILITLTLLAIILCTLIYKLNHIGQPYNSLQTLNLPRGSRVISQSLGLNTLAIHIQTQQNQQAILLYDYKYAKIISQVTLHSAL